MQHARRNRRKKATNAPIPTPGVGGITNSMQMFIRMRQSGKIPDRWLDCSSLSGLQSISQPCPSLFFFLLPALFLEHLQLLLA